MNLGPVELIVLFFFLLIPLTLGYVSGKVWQSKGGDFWLLFVVGLIPPVVGLLIAFLASPGATSPRNVVAVVKVLDKDRRLIGTGNHTGFSPAGKAIIEVPRRFTTRPRSLRTSTARSRTCCSRKADSPRRATEGWRQDWLLRVRPGSAHPGK